jgi:hypothetical protein
MRCRGLFPPNFVVNFLLAMPGRSASPPGPRLSSRWKPVAWCQFEQKQWTFSFGENENGAKLWPRWLGVEAADVLGPGADGDRS